MTNSDENDLQKVISDVKNGRTSIRKVSKHHTIPYGTLHKKCNDCIPTNKPEDSHVCQKTLRKY